MANLEYSVQIAGPAAAANRAQKYKRRFLSFFPRGFDDPKYFDWERGYKIAAHAQWQEALNRKRFSELLKDKRYIEIAAAAIRIESRTNLLFSFEKMALRDAVKSCSGAEIFAAGLYNLLYGRAGLASRFDKWCSAVAALPRKQTRVLTHPVVTVFPYIADPVNHIFLKPTVTKRAAAGYGFNFDYSPTPSWEVYSQLLAFAKLVASDIADLRPKDMIDIQSFMWAIASDEYRSMGS